MTTRELFKSYLDNMKAFDEVMNSAEPDFLKARGHFVKCDRVLVELHDLNVDTTLLERQAFEGNYGLDEGLYIEQKGQQR